MIKLSKLEQELLLELFKCDISNRTRLQILCHLKNVKYGRVLFIEYLKNINDSKKNEKNLLNMAIYLEKHDALNLGFYLNYDL